MKIEKDAKELRAVYAEGLIALAEKDDRIVICEADLMNANGTKAFLKAFPERTFAVCNAPLPRSGYDFLRLHQTAGQNRRHRPRHLRTAQRRYAHEPGRYGADARHCQHGRV